MIQDTTNTNKKPPGGKVKNRRIRLLMIALLGFMCWACAIFWHQIGDLREKSGSLKVLEAKLADAQKSNQEIKREIARLNDNEYIEQKVREEYHYTRPGETIFMPSAGQ